VRKGELNDHNDSRELFKLLVCFDFITRECFVCSRTNSGHAWFANSMQNNLRNFSVLLFVVMVNGEEKKSFKFCEISAYFDYAPIFIMGIFQRSIEEFPGI
jgi:hypothetical protein